MNLNTGSKLITAERDRQIREEGYSAAHDDEHGAEGLLKAAHSYFEASGPRVPVPETWPWGPQWWKPRSRKRNLVRAGALALAAADCARRASDMDRHLDAKVFADRCAAAIDLIPVMDLNAIAAQNYDWVERMGWHNKTILDAMALIASEVGQAAAECLTANPTAAYGEKLADIALRTADLAHWQKVDLEAAVAAASVASRTGGGQAVAMAELMVDVASWINTARVESLGADFARALGTVFRRVQVMAERADVDLDAEIRRKMEINEQRGTRGRVV